MHGPAFFQSKVKDQRSFKKEIKHHLAKWGACVEWKFFGAFKPENESPLGCYCWRSSKVLPQPAKKNN